MEYFCRQTYYWVNSRVISSKTLDEDELRIELLLSLCLSVEAAWEKTDAGPENLFHAFYIFARNVVSCLWLWWKNIKAKWFTLGKSHFIFWLSCSEQLTEAAVERNLLHFNQQQQLLCLHLHLWDKGDFYIFLTNGKLIWALTLI